ncbi:MAG: protein phosphatase 2C domain-containing protein [Sulfuricella sp.]|nr:protein phosphatase 2C domain-containing protein [Sulfuricella sp.]
MKFSIFQSSRQGGRKYNQDRLAYSYSRDTLLMVVADGMGGHFHGEIASQIVVQFLVDNFQKQATPALQDPFRFLLEAIGQAHEAIGDYVLAHGLRDHPRTTCIACVVQGGSAYWAHVGDTRLYLFRNGKLVMRTRDHSLVQQMFERGQISEDQMTTHPDRNKIYNCLGGPIPPDIELSRKTPLREGDTLLLCSDGLWSLLSASEIASILDTYPITTAVPELLDHAELRGGEEGDNLSAIGMRWGDESEVFNPRSISTATMPLDSFTVELDAFDMAQGKHGEMEVSEADIERAIAEIQTAIRKYSK